MTKILDAIGYDKDGFIEPTCTNTRSAWNKFVCDMMHNNTYCPEPVRVIYNVGTKAYYVRDEKNHRIKDENGNYKMTEPVKVLTTVVFFDDNTKVTVTNSANDGVKFIKVRAIADDPNSPEVETADEASKETGFVHATVKRLMGYADKNGTIQGDGYGRKLHDIVVNAYDTAVSEAANKYKNKLSKAEYTAKLHTAKPKRPSFADTVVDLRKTVDGLQEVISILKADIEAAKAAANK